MTDRRQGVERPGLGPGVVLRRAHPQPGQPVQVEDVEITQPTSGAATAEGHQQTLEEDGSGMTYVQVHVVRVVYMMI